MAAALRCRSSSNSSWSTATAACSRAARLPACRAAQGRARPGAQAASRRQRLPPAADAKAAAPAAQQPPAAPPAHGSSAITTATSSSSSSAGGAGVPSSWLSSEWDRDILALALPAALALAADPLLSMVDTALVGQLGPDELAALGINSALFSLSFVVFNFLATATTPLVAAAAASGDARRAGETVWQAGALALLLGGAVSAGLLANGPWLLQLMGADASQQHMQDLALQYLLLRACAAPAVLLTTVGQGVFRGVLNTRVPLLITLATNALHLGLDLLLMFEPVGWGIRGAAASTAASEWLAAAAYTWLLAAGPTREQLGLWPPPPPLQLAELRQRCLPFLQAGGAVLMRTGSLLGTKTLATAVAARMGPSAVASHQVLMQIWVLASMLVDSLAVSGQTLVAVRLSSGDAASARRLSERLLQLGGGLGLALALLAGGSASLWPHAFTPDEDVLRQIGALVPLAVAPLPINALVYTLDGILVGASDFTYLMAAMVGASALASGLLLAVEPAGGGLQGVWAGLAVLMVSRLATLGWRFQSHDGPLPPLPRQAAQQQQQQQQQQQHELAMLEHGQQQHAAARDAVLAAQQQRPQQLREPPAPAALNNNVPCSRQLQARRHAVDGGAEAGACRPGSGTPGDVSQ